MFKLNNPDSKSCYRRRADALMAASLWSITQPSVQVDEHDDSTGGYTGSIVLTLSCRYDDTAPKRWPPVLGEHD